MVYSALRLCALLVLFAFAIGAGQAYAGPQSADDGCLTEAVCKGHYNQAIKLFEEGRFESALPEFQAAYQRRQMPWLLINIGRTLHRLGRSREALEHYERFQRAELNADAETRARVQKYIEQARALSESAGSNPPPSPEGSGQPPAVTTPPASEPTTVVSTPPATTTEPPRPIYKKWWFWTAVGGGVAVAVIVGVTAGVLANQSGGLPGGVTKVTFSF